MLITINKKKFTDNSKEANGDVSFVYSFRNEIFCSEALKNGCKELISSNKFHTYFDFTSIKIIGITGTNGKTTTTTAICSILLNLGYKVALQGTQGFFINNKKIEAYTLTTPVQLVNFSHIQQAIDNNCDFFVMEVTSHSIDQKRVEGLNFELKVHTNIQRDHLDYHKTLKKYIEVKNSFFSDNSKKLINTDDKVVRFNAKNSYTYSFNKAATYKVIKYFLEGETKVIFSHENKEYSFLSSIMGIFNIYNLMAAIASVHIATKGPLNKICDVAKNFKGVSGRMEIVNTYPLIIIDFAHNPDGMKKIYESFKHKDIITVFGAGGNRDKEKRSIMGEIAQNYAKYIIVTSDNPRFEEPTLIIEDICKEITKKNNLITQVDRKKAIQKGIELLKENKKGVLLILGKGDEPYQIIGNKKVPLLDKDEVLKNI